MKKPYEFLVRWDLKTGKIAAHCGFVQVFEEDGEVHIGQPQPVVPVALGVASGFPLADVLSAVEISALQQSEQAVANLSAAEQQHISDLQRLRADHAQQLADQMERHAEELQALRDQHAAAMTSAQENLQRMARDADQALQDQRNQSQAALGERAVVISQLTQQLEAVTAGKAQG